MNLNIIDEGLKVNISIVNETPDVCSLEIIDAATEPSIVLNIQEEISSVFDPNANIDGGIIM